MLLRFDITGFLRLPPDLFVRPLAPLALCLPSSLLHPLIGTSGLYSVKLYLSVRSLLLVPLVV